MDKKHIKYCIYIFGVILLIHVFMNKTNIEEPDYTYALFDTHDTQPSYTIGDYGWIENFE